MTQITASEARRNWFQLLDRVAAGETIVIERKGRRLLLCRDEIPDYSAIIRAVADVSRADDWSWDWDHEGGLRPHDAGDE
jgi:hypothetical protein